jgi:hypothetical protein
MVSKANTLPLSRMVTADLLAHPDVSCLREGGQGMGFAVVFVKERPSCLMKHRRC